MLFAKIINLKNTLLLLTLLSFSAAKHPFYLSVTDLSYNQKEKALQGSVKIFTNDLEAALKKKYNKTIDLLHVGDSVFTKKVLNDYLTEHLQISVNQTARDIRFLGFEQEEEATWIYIEMVNIPSKPKHILIQNSILYDHIKDQMNIVHLNIGGDKKSYKVNCPEREMRFEF